MSDDDLSRYLPHIAHLDLPHPRKLELLRTVREFMRSFVDRAFGDDPTQLALKAGGVSAIAGDRQAPSVVGSSRPTTTIEKTRGLSGQFGESAAKKDHARP